ncbi:MAG: response regulator [Gemmataceae bacterium]|nr:response regulator [Gemmataceae bacterium]
MHTVHPSDRRRVTLVDDEPYALDVLMRAARSWNFDCQAAASAEEAVALLERQPTPIVVTDLRMPGRGGVWLVQEIQKRWPDTSIIVITAGQDDDALSQCLVAGAQHYFLKPINFDEFHHALTSTMRSYLHRREKEKNRRRLEQSLDRQRRELRRTFFSAIDCLVRTLEARDRYTSGHSLRVRDYSARLGQRLGLSPRRLKRLSLAAKLHDIGKVGLAEGILNKPTALSPEEYSNVRDHPVIGERILAPIIRSQEVLAAIRHHHERFDGNGYPDGLRGADIPYLARVITLADCFDALTSSRAYRAALSPKAALDIMRSEAGRQFDPDMLPAFVSLVIGH